MMARTCLRGSGLICFCLAVACACQGQTNLGDVNVGNGTMPVQTLPFTCNVDGVVFLTIAACVSFVPTGTTSLPGRITSNTPEHITALPWDPGTFTGILQLGTGSNGTTCTASGPSGPTLNCWLTEVPIIIGSGMTIVGSGRVASGGNFDTGTAIAPGAAFPAALGQPNLPSLACTGSGTLSGTFTVSVVEVNELNSFSGSALAVPGLSAESGTATMTCANVQEVTVTPPVALGTGPFAAKDYRVFATLMGAPNETLQVPDGVHMSCSIAASVDKAYACGFGSGSVAEIISVLTGGDFPNFVDLSNPLVVEIGPLGGTGTQTQNEGFGSVLENLTLALPAASSTNNHPNVAFWDPSNQENSGLSFVGFSGVTANTSPAETGAWAYIGNHAPNSFVSHVQTSTDPASGTFYAMILDGRPGFGTALGTARRVSDSTFTPGRVAGGGATIPAGILIMGSKAVTNFSQVHVEVPSTTGSGSAFEIDSGASVSIVGPTQLAASGSPLVHLAASGAAVMVKNILGPSSTQTAVQDDVNQVSVVGPFVANYSSSLQAGNLQVLKTFTLPNQNANLIYAGPASGAAAAPAFRALVPADLPTGGTVQMLGGGQAGVVSGTNSIYLPWLGGGTSATGNGVSAIVPSTGTIAGLFVGVNSPYGTSLTVRFTVASCTPSMEKPCVPVDSNLACSITGTLVTQCSQTLAADALPVTQGDEVFLHAMVPVGSTIPTRNVFMSYRLTGVQ